MKKREVIDILREHSRDLHNSRQYKRREILDYVIDWVEENSIDDLIGHARKLLTGE
jgi:hypothetical protein